MVHWLSALIKALELETVDGELLNHIDEVLNWKNVRNQNDEYIKLLEEIGEHSIDVRYEELLDRLVVGDFALGEMFPASLDDESAKNRYRKLIRIFHPDKGSKSQVWLNYRAEKINKAYQMFVETDVAPAVEIDMFTSGEQSSNNKVKTKAESKNNKFNIKFRYRPNAWRERLGNPKQFQKKVLSILFIFAFILVFFAYWSNNGVDTLNSAENLRGVGVNGLVNSNNEKENIPNDYIKDARAKKILLEADRFLSEESDLNDEIIGVNQIGNDQLDYQSLDELDDFIYRLEEAGLLTANESPSDKLVDEGCGDFLNISPLIIDDKNKKRSLASSQNLYSGPSKKCDLLAVLNPESEIVIFSNSADELWMKVISNQSQNLIGWMNVEDLELKLNDTTGNLIDEKQVQVEKKLIDVSNQVNKNTPHNAVAVQSVKEIKRVPQSFEPKYQTVQPNIKTNTILDRSNNYKASIYLMLLEDLKEYYQIGDSKKIAGLYIGSGRENKIRGAEQIRKYYKQAFKKTSNRKFDYSIESFREEDDSTAVIQGTMNLSLKTIKTGAVDKINATFTIWVFKLGESYKIVSFEWDRK